MSFTQSESDALLNNAVLKSSNTCSDYSHANRNFLSNMEETKPTCCCSFFTCMSRFKPARCIHIILFSLRMFLFLSYFIISSMISKIITMLVVIPRVDVNAAPSPVLFLDSLKGIYPHAFKVVEIMTGIMVFLLVLISIFHNKYERGYILSRFLFLMGFLMNLRSLCICMTTFSIPTRELKESCVKMQKLTMNQLAIKGINFFEFSETCGDYVFSGHATGLVISTWFVWYYGTNLPILNRLPNKVSAFIRILMSLLLIGVVLSGCICILLAKEHYSVDVILGTVLSIMACSLYHLQLEKFRIDNTKPNQNCSILKIIHFWYSLFDNIDSNPSNPNQKTKENTKLSLI